MVDEDPSEFLKKLRMNTTDSQKVPESKFSEVIQVSVPTGKYLPILEQARELIDWIYDTNKRDTKIRSIPFEVRGSMSIATISGILQELGKPNRPKVKPEPFIICYGRYCDIQGRMCIYTKEMITFPFPELPDGTDLVKINIVRVTADQSVYYLKVLKDVPDSYNISENIMPFVMVDDTNDY